MSSTSFSPSNSVLPQLVQTSETFGLVIDGSTGSSSSPATFTALHCLQYQTGIAVLKIRCLDMHQSHSIDSTQFFSLIAKCSGYHFISSDARIISTGITRMNHCSVEMISIGVLQRQQIPTLCSIGSCLLSNPCVFKSSIILFLHSVTLSPL